MRVLRQTLLIPLGFVITMCLGAVWLGNTYAKVIHNAKDIETVKTQHDTYNQHFIDIKSELGEIKGELKRIKK